MTVKVRVPFQALSLRWKIGDRGNLEIWKFGKSCAWSCLFPNVAMRAAVLITCRVGGLVSSIEGGNMNRAVNWCRGLPINR
jgi:hypothetical protein